MQIPSSYHENIEFIFGKDLMPLGPVAGLFVVSRTAELVGTLQFEIRTPGYPTELRLYDGSDGPLEAPVPRNRRSWQQVV